MTGGRPAERPSSPTGPGTPAERASGQTSDLPAPPAQGAAPGAVHAERGGRDAVAGSKAKPTSRKPGDTAARKSSGGKSRRPALTSDHFSLTWRRADPARRASSGQRPASARVPTSAPAIHRAPRLMMAVAKKLLPRAIDRNTVRRITREAWRAVEAGHPDLDLFVRLQAKPKAWSALPDGQRKRACRTELDALLAKLPSTGAPK